MDQALDDGSELHANGGLLRKREKKVCFAALYRPWKQGARKNADGLIRQDARAKQFMKLTGIGDTTGTALIAMIGNTHDSKCGRQLRAWLGLAPGRSSSREEITARASRRGGSVRARV